MRDLVDFFAQCARSGTLLTSLCAIVLIPIGAWFACRFITPAIVRMKGDTAWQAPLAAVAAALPGALFVALWIGAMFTGLRSACLSVPAGRFVFGVLITAMIAALARATWLAAIRAIGIRGLVRASSAPSSRLRVFAALAGVCARELPEQSPLCALAGAWSPVVLVSTGVLASISDEELLAALQHERAHARRGDQLLAAGLAFLVDLLPLPASDLVETYRAAREFAADEEAVRLTSADALAGALIEFAKGGRAIVGAACLTDDHPSLMVKRLHALLEPDAASPRPNRMRRLALVLSLAAIAAAGFLTPSLAGQRTASCTLVMSANR